MTMTGLSVGGERERASCVKTPMFGKGVRGLGHREGEALGQGERGRVLMIKMSVGGTKEVATGYGPSEMDR